jgi:hypothetical protein
VGYLTREPDRPGADRRDRIESRRYPRCDSKQVSRIIYGLITPQGAERYRGKNVIFCGCGVPPAEPRWECRECGLRFGGAVGEATRGSRDA